MSFYANVTGWDAEGDSVEGDGWGMSEDTAVAAAISGARIVEVGDVRTVPREVNPNPLVS